MNITMWRKALRVIPSVSKEEWDHLDVISKWLISTRAAVLIMTFISAAIAGIFALQSGDFDFWLWLLVAVGLGLQKIETSVQLLKLFDANAKIIRDYRWLEGNFGKLVPMELVVRVAPSLQRPPLEELAQADEATRADAVYQLSFLDRIELAESVQRWVEHVFGEEGSDIVGRGNEDIANIIVGQIRLLTQDEPGKSGNHRRGRRGSG